MLSHSSDRRNEMDFSVKVLQPPFELSIVTGRQERFKKLAEIPGNG
jgi:hypothetical protein